MQVIQGTIDYSGVENRFSALRGHGRRTPADRAERAMVRFELSTLFLSAETRLPQRTLLAGAITLMVLIWGTTWAVIRIGLEGIPPFAGVALRFAIAAAILYVLGRAWRVPDQRGPRLYRIWFVETVFSLCVPYGVVYWAEQWVPSGLSSILFSTMPLFVAVLAHWWLVSEPMRPAETSGILIAVLGVAFIFSDDLTLAARPEVLLPALVFLTAPLAAAVSHVLIKRWGRGIHPMNVVTVPMALTGLTMGALSLAVESERAFTFDVQAVAALFYLAVFGSALTFSLYYWVLERVAATRLSLITLGIPVVAVLVGTLAMSEPFSARAALGSLLVLLGVGVASRAAPGIPAGDRPA